MILSEQRHVMEPIIAKLDSSDDEFTVPRVYMKPSVSPSKPTNNLQVVLDDENDDDDERSARRKSRLLEPHPAGVGSPCANGSTVRRRVDAAAPRGISQAQIGEHYGNCIRLAAENKITSKNAFNLHLIDYMSDMLKKEDYASFQIASSSLDAGAKIYAGRVDAVHQETYQVLTGLGRSDKPPPTGDDAEEGEDAADGGPSGKPDQRKRTAVHRDIIQKQLSKIRQKSVAAKVDVDPLFQHQTAAYDEGGIAELRVNQLRSLDGTCVLILDSTTRVLQSPAQTVAGSVNLTGIMDYFSLIMPKAAGQLVMCPSLEDFQFTNWNKNEKSNSSFETSKMFLGSPHESKYTPQDYADDDDADIGADAPTLDDTIVPAPVENTVVCGASAEAANGGQLDEVGVHDVTTAQNGNTDSQTNGTDGELFVSSLKQMLDKQYEHFGQLNDHLLGMWAGPEHWRKKAKRRKFDPATGRDVEEDIDSAADNAEDGTETIHQVGKSRKCSRPKRSKSARMVYTEATLPSENRVRNGTLSRRDWSKCQLTEGIPDSAAANATVCKEQYRQKASRQANLLPSEWADSRNSLYQLFNREVILEPSHQPGLQVNGNETNALNYGNTTSEFCPLTDLANNPIDEENPHDVSDIADQQLDGPLCVIDDDDDDDINLPFEGAFTQMTGGVFGDLGPNELELVSQPRKIARIQIGYAKTAKMINVRRLKQAMWNSLEDSIPIAGAPPKSPISVASTSSAPTSSTGEVHPDHPDSDKQTQEGDDSASHPNSRISGARSFSDLIGSLSTRISWHMAKELSISIALNCLLHLSNEKELYLECSRELTDIYISQGLPEFELDMLRQYNMQREGDFEDAPCAEGSSAKRPAGAGARQGGKTKRHRSSTLDSWLGQDSLETQGPS
ncbi:unnamed protein product [Calicophoron daubneyi]|uniref:Condensin complex subunit 2 n=1 Tax=Calicophoron daubneyi TaxID=300641 RepID=A0AAV2TRU2_CALDB